MATPAARPAAVDALLLDGAVVTVRPVTAADSEALLDLYRDTSESSLRLRFFTSSPHVIDAEVARLTRPADDKHVAVVAVDRGRILGVGLWERTGASSAEFALLVRDGLHGQGVGTLLLEHLLAAARDARMTTVTATVLADNTPMLRVLRDLGATRQTELDSGVVEVTLDLKETPAWQSAVGARESLAEHASLHRILAARSIAVVGAGRRDDSIGHRLLAGLIDGGYDGRLYAVNRSDSPVLGVPSAPSVRAIGKPIDAAVIAVPADAVLDVANDCAAAGVYGLVVVSDGFAEAGPEGAERQRRLQALVRAAGMRLIGPNCLGFLSISPQSRINATFADVRPSYGGVGLASQSGGVGLALLDFVTRRHLGISSFVSMGNKADVSGNDLLMYWQHDPTTTVCALYLESFGNARKFARVARRVARTKPVVAVTAGRSVAGARGTRSHTAAAAAPDVAVDALFRQAGVIRAVSLGEMLDIVALLAAAPLPRGRRVAVVSNTGGPAALAADACGAAGLELPSLSEETERAVRAAVPRAAAVSNPVDTTAQVTAAELVAACGVLVACDDVDSVVAMHTSIRAGDADEVAAALKPIAATADKPLLAVFLGHGPVDESAAPDDVVVPSFALPETAARALAAVTGYAQWRDRPEEPPVALDSTDPTQVRRIVDVALASAPDGCWLDTDDAVRVVASYGVPVVPTVRVDTQDEAVAAARRLGFPAVVKSAAGEVVHRTDVGAVRVGLTSGAEVRAAVREVRAAVGRGAPVVVQPVAASGVETAVGMTVDPTIGPLVMVALGGVATELLADRALRLVPVGRTEAAAQVRSLRAAQLLFGYRGSPPCDVAALEDVIVRVSRLAEDFPEIADIDLNPVVVRPDGVCAVDVKLRVAPVRAPDPYLRRLSIVAHD